MRELDLWISVFLFIFLEVQPHGLFGVCRQKDMGHAQIFCMRTIDLIPIYIVNSCIEFYCSISPPSDPRQLGYLEYDWLVAQSRTVLSGEGTDRSRTTEGARELIHRLAWAELCIFQLSSVWEVQGVYVEKRGPLALLWDVSLNFYESFDNAPSHSRK